MNELHNDEIGQACKTSRTILRCLTAVEELLCKGLDLLRYADNLAAISKLLLYVRVFSGMPYNCENC